MRGARAAARAPCAARHVGLQGGGHPWRLVAPQQVDDRVDADRPSDEGEGRDECPLLGCRGPTIAPSRYISTGPSTRSSTGNPGGAPRPGSGPTCARRGSKCAPSRSQVLDRTLTVSDSPPVRGAHHDRLDHFDRPVRRPRAPRVPRLEDIAIVYPDDRDTTRRASPGILLIDQRPAAVASPTNACEVVRIVRAARILGLQVAPQSTGHNAGPLAAQSSTT